MKKILITGASGYLANTLIPIAAARAEVVGVARNASAIRDQVKAVSLDITQKSAVLEVLLSEQPDAIIHCAASNPGGDEGEMVSINEFGSANVAAAAHQLGCRLVAVSSDTIFNGKDAPFNDDAVPSPLAENVYAVSKAGAEAAIFSVVPEALVVRTSLIYGTEQIDRGTQSFIDRLAAGDTLQLFTDVIRQPVFVQSLSESLCALALDHVNESGTVNIAGDEPISRYDFGVRMLEHWGVDYADQLRAVSGVGIAGLPIDLRMGLTRAHALGLSTPGVTAVLQQSSA